MSIYVTNTPNALTTQRYILVHADMNNIHYNIFKLIETRKVYKIDWNSWSHLTSGIIKVNFFQNFILKKIHLNKVQ